jgi:hypothetical protein
MLENKINIIKKYRAAFLAAEYNENNLFLCAESRVQMESFKSLSFENYC